MSEKHKTPNCTNCSYKFIYANNYCPVCGQKNHNLRIPLKHLLEEIIETTLHFDSKTIRTVKKLLLKPGFLSLEFNSGRRADYVPPIRLYVLISFVFFFLLSFLSGGHKSETDSPGKHKTESGITFSYGQINSKELSGLSATQVDSLMATKKIEQTGMNKYIIHKLQKIANSSSAEFIHLLMKNISYMMFLLMPLFGAWIYLFNRKQLYYYIEGLTISVHFHGFAFLIFTIMLLLSAIASMEIFILLAFMVIPIYMLLMFKRVMKQSWFMTIIKTIIIGVLYMFSLSILLVITIVVSTLFV